MGDTLESINGGFGVFGNAAATAARSDQKK